MALIPPLENPSSAAKSSDVSQTQNWTPIRGQICEPIDISNTIRLGLVGGGLTPVEALTKTREYVEKRPPVENLMFAQAILSAGLVGAPEEKPGKKAGRRTRSKRSRTGKSGSPRSTELARR